MAVETYHKPSGVLKHNDAVLRIRGSCKDQAAALSAGGSLLLWATSIWEKDEGL